MPLSVALSTNDITVAPGDTGQIAATLTNLGEQSVTARVTVGGLAAVWTTPEPGVIALGPGERCDIALSVSPPRSPTVPAGATPLDVRVSAHDDPEGGAGAEAVVHVLAFSARRVTVLQPVLQGRRRATFDVVVENLGNMPASVRLTCADPAQRTTSRWSPPSVGVEPGRSVISTVDVRARRLRWRGRPDPITLDIAATQDGHVDARSASTFLHLAVLPARWGQRVAAAFAVLGALVALWWGAITPIVERAAERAAEEAVTEALGTLEVDRVPVTTDTQTGSPVDPVGPQQPARTEGELFAFRLPVTVTSGDTGSQSFDTPSGARVEITDIVLQNPNGDLGTARLLRNDDVLLTWRLDNVIGDDVKQFVSPYELRTGDRLTLEVSCTAPGDLTVMECTTSATFTGRLVGERG